MINCLPPGFKYIGNTALALVEKGFEVPFGYEEAIGFMIGSEIHDKDGVTAMVRTCPMKLLEKTLTLSRFFLLS